MLSPEAVRGHTGLHTGVDADGEEQGAMAVGVLMMGAIALVVALAVGAVVAVVALTGRSGAGGGR